MTKEEMIRDLERRIENCKKRIAEIERNPIYTGLGGTLTISGIAKVSYWKGELHAYNNLLDTVKGE